MYCISFSLHVYKILMNRKYLVIAVLNLSNSPYYNFTHILFVSFCYISMFYCIQTVFKMFLLTHEKIGRGLKEFENSFNSLRHKCPPSVLEYWKIILEDWKIHHISVGKFRLVQSLTTLALLWYFLLLSAGATSRFPEKRARIEEAEIRGLWYDFLYL